MDFVSAFTIVNVGAFTIANANGFVSAFTIVSKHQRFYYGWDTIIAALNFNKC